MIQFSSNNSLLGCMGVEHLLQPCLIDTTMATWHKRLATINFVGPGLFLLDLEFQII